MFLNIIQLAESMGVEEAVVEGWIRKEGLPCVRDSGRLLFDRAQVVQWATERGLAARAGFLAKPRGQPSSLSLAALLRTGGIWRDVSPPTVLSVFEQVLSRLPATTPEIRRVLIGRMSLPGGITWAPVGRGWALPHLRVHVALGREAGLMSLLLLSGELQVAEPPADGVPVRRLVFFLAPSPRAHLEILALMSAALSRGELGRGVTSETSDAAILSAVSRSNPGAEVGA